MKTRLPDIWRRPIVRAIALVALVNCALFVANPFKHVDPDAIPAAKSWVWWTRHDYIQQKDAPDIVLLGSSLLMNPIWQSEAAYRKHDVDIVTQRDVQYLDHSLQKLVPGSRGTTFNFALPGAMISDDYMIVRCVFDEEKKPKIAVLGLSPVDIMDSDFWCPAASSHYKYLKRFTHSDDLVEMLMPKLWQRVQYYANELQYLTSRKHDVQVVAGEQMKKQIAGALAPVSAPLVESKAKDAAQAIFQTDIQEGVWLAHSKGFDYFNDNSAEFKKKYLSTSRGNENRRKWLATCIELCRSKNIEPLVLNMPLAPSAIAVFPPGLYDESVAVMRDEAQKHKCCFVDVEKSGQFDLRDFNDVCHMDASGGKKVLDLIANTIANDKRLKDALLSRHGTLAQTGSPGI